MLSPRRCPKVEAEVCRHYHSPAIKNEETVFAVSSHETENETDNLKDEEISCMDLCISSSSDDSNDDVGSFGNDIADNSRCHFSSHVVSSALATKQSPEKSTSTKLKHKLLLARDIFGSPTREKERKKDLIIDLCSSSDDELEHIDEGEQIPKSLNKAVVDVVALPTTLPVATKQLTVLQDATGQIQQQQQSKISDKTEKQNTSSPPLPKHDPPLVRTWKCDYCAAVFYEYKDAITHETDCKTGKEKLPPDDRGESERFCKRPKFDQVCHAGRVECSYNMSSMEPSMLLSASKNVIACSSSNKNNSDWRGFGLFSGDSHQLKVMPLKDVRPAFSPSELSFLSEMKIFDVKDLEQAQVNALGMQLFDSSNFKVACAFYAWKDGKPLRDFLKFSVARNIVVKWKKKLAQKSSGCKEITENELVSKTNDSESMRQSSIRETAEAEDILLTDLLSREEARMLRDYFEIETATQLINADCQYITQILCERISYQFDGRSPQEVKYICEGLLLAWMLRSREAVECNESTATTMEVETSESEDDQIKQSGILTPLSYVDCLFFEQEGISTDRELSRIDPSLLSRHYTAFLNMKGKFVSNFHAHNHMLQLRQNASLVLNGEAVVESSTHKNRLDLSTLPGVMVNASNLCKTTNDKISRLPKKTIFTYDDQNFVLYEFLITINDSQIPNSGKGAFLTFMGARVLKKSSKWKCKEFSKSPRTPRTRQPREALFAGSGATVTLKGKNLHGDEYFYEIKKADSVGIWDEFSRDDFVDTGRNITFSSTHVGCALIELDRYAPVIPADRKTEFLFGMKDFVFSHEPQSWRFDVKEKLNGQRQVVDFTDDHTGSPHDVARANTAMYVNEVGHDISLVENVCSLETCRSVSYYIYIDRPMESGETRELLINYKEGYEEMRVRRGYGVANIHHGVKGDDDDLSRILRNQNERLQTEATIMTCSEDEIGLLVNFIQERVLSGVVEATSNITSGADLDVLSRQHVARRRIHWLSQLCQRRLLELISNEGEKSPSDDHSCIFCKGMIVYVHGWMDKHDPRPPYEGLATIMSVSKDKYDRHCFELSLPRGKCISGVPAAVVTLPDENHFVDAPLRLRLDFIKSQKGRLLPHKRDALLFDLSSVQNIALVQHLPPEENSRRSLKWELAEEVFFKANKQKVLDHPLNEVVAKVTRLIESDDCSQDADTFVSFYEKLRDVIGLNSEDEII